MVTKFKKEICEILIDRYESRYHNGSDFSRKISLKFNEADYKKYVAEDAYKYRDAIDEAVREMAKADLTSVVYEKGSKEITEIKLNCERVKDIYALLERINIAERYTNFLDGLLCIGTETSRKLYEKLIAKRRLKESLKKYIEAANDYFDAAKAIDAIRKLEQDIFIRNLSAILFKDSKRLESLGHYVAEIYSLVNEVDTPWDEYLLQNGVLRNPNYIYVKGTAVLQVNEQSINLKKLGTAFSICSDSIENTHFLSVDAAIVTTIENLTTFHDYKGSELTIYLGGFSNHSKVRLLKKLNADIKGLAFRHFGDMDFGGFSILSHLRRETGINIQPLHMDINALRRKIELTKKPSKTYLGKLKELLDDELLCDCKDVIEYMMKNEIILEQEAF